MRNTTYGYLVIANIIILVLASYLWSTLPEGNVISGHSVNFTKKLISIFANDFVVSAIVAAIIKLFSRKRNLIKIFLYSFLLLALNQLIFIILGVFAPEILANIVNCISGIFSHIYKAEAA